MIYEKKSLGEKLRKLRESFQLSQGQVAEALNLDRSTYTNYELDKTRPSLETLVKLASIYNVQPVHLLPDITDSDAVAFRDATREDGLMRSLNKEERGMIVFYRSLSRQDKEKLRRQMKGMISGQE